MTSVRQSLKLVGKAASIKQLAHKRKASFPLSLRQFVGAPSLAKLAIEAKRGALRQQGIDVGAPQRDVQSMIFGGATQDFERGSIYWHPNTAAHYLSGPILDAYRSLKGPDFDPQTYRRPLGYPASDNTVDVDRNLEFVEFEFGSIYCIEGHFVFSIHQGLAGSLPKMGVPLFTRADRFRLAVGPITGTPSSSSRIDAVIATIQSLWQGRIALQAVDRPGEFVDLAVLVSILRETNGMASSLEQSASLPAGATLRERTLYNVVLKDKQGGIMNVAPHAVYIRADWERFGIIHATDLHVSFRADGFPGRFGNRFGQGYSYYNPNDAFRHFIRYANRLHRKGLLDLLLITGDLVDYQFERGHDRAMGGNFELFEQLILGQAPSPTGVPLGIATWLCCRKPAMWVV